MVKPSLSNPLGFAVQRQYDIWGICKRAVLEARFASKSNLYTKDLFAHYGCVNAIEFSNRGDLLVSGGDDKRVLIWNVERAIEGSWKPNALRTQHTSNIFCLGFDSTNSKVFSAGNDDHVIVHDTATGGALASFRHEQAVYGLSIDPLNDNVFASACDDGRALIFDVREPSNSDPFCLAEEGSPFHGVMFNPVEPRLVLTANAYNGVELWDVRMPREVLLTYTNTLTEGCMSARFNRLGTHILALRRRAPAVVYTTHSPDHLHEFDHNTYYNSCTMKSCCFAGENDEFIVCGSDDFNLYVWRLPESENVKIINESHMIVFGHRSIVNQVRFNPENYLLASSGVEKVIKVWSPMPLPDGSANLFGENPPKNIPRTKYTHADYVRLVLQSGEFMTHDYSHESTGEDPRMMAFFDSLVQRELEGWTSDDSNSSVHSQSVVSSSDVEVRESSVPEPNYWDIPFEGPSLRDSQEGDVGPSVLETSRNRPAAFVNQERYVGRPFLDPSRVMPLLIEDDGSDTLLPPSPGSNRDRPSTFEDDESDGVPPTLPGIFRDWPSTFDHDGSASLPPDFPETYHYRLSEFDNDETASLPAYYPGSYHYRPSTFEDDGGASLPSPFPGSFRERPRAFALDSQRNPEPRFMEAQNRTSHFIPHKQTQFIRLASCQPPEEEVQPLLMNYLEQRPIVLPESSVSCRSEQEVALDEQADVEHSLECQTTVSYGANSAELEPESRNTPRNHILCPHSGLSNNEEGEENNEHMCGIFPRLFPLSSSSNEGLMISEHGNLHNFFTEGSNSEVVIHENDNYNQDDSSKGVPIWEKWRKYHDRHVNSLSANDGEDERTNNVVQNNTRDAPGLCQTIPNNSHKASFLSTNSTNRQHDCHEANSMGTKQVTSKEKVNTNIAGSCAHFDETPVASRALNPFNIKNDANFLATILADFKSDNDEDNLETVRFENKQLTDKYISSTQILNEHTGSCKINDEVPNTSQNSRTYIPLDTSCDKELKSLQDTVSSTCDRKQPYLVWDQLTAAQTTFPGESPLYQNHWKCTSLAYSQSSDNSESEQADIKNTAVESGMGTASTSKNDRLLESKKTFNKKQPYSVRTQLPEESVPTSCHRKRSSHILSQEIELKNRKVTKKRRLKCLSSVSDFKDSDEDKNSDNKHTVENKSSNRVKHILSSESDKTVFERSKQVTNSSNVDRKITGSCTNVVQVPNIAADSEAFMQCGTGLGSLQVSVPSRSDWKQQEIEDVDREMTMTNNPLSYPSYSSQPTNPCPQSCISFHINTHICSTNSTWTEDSSESSEETSSSTRYDWVTSQKFKN